MATKRRPVTNLNHDNWDEEDAPEERGEFRMAPEEELKTRVIKTARRRLGNGNGSDPAKSVFSGFSGFGSGATTTASQEAKPASSIFAFLNTTTNQSTAPKTESAGNSLSWEFIKTINA